MFNTAVAPFDDVRVRMGLDAVEQPGTSHRGPRRHRHLAAGHAVVLPGQPVLVRRKRPTPSRVRLRSRHGAAQEYVNDPARSDGKAVGEPIDVELSCPPDPTLIAAMQVIEQVWSRRDLVNVSLTQFDQQTHINNAINDAAPQAHCWRWSR